MMAPRTERAQAARPARPGAPRRRGSRSGSGAAAYLAIPVFAAAYLVVDFYRPLPIWVVGLYLATSVLCFVVYAVDKSAAVAGRRRVPERTLLLLGLAGGWPGAIIAQQTLRHKTKKTSFRAAFWASVAGNVVAFVALGSPLIPLWLPALHP